MRMKEYNAYMEKRNLILKKLNELNVDDSILSYLESQDINIEDNDISIIVGIVKRIIFDFNMYGIDSTIKMMEDNNDYLFSGFTNRDNNSIEQLRNSISTTLGKNKIYDDINSFALSTATIVNQNLNKKQQQYVNKYVYAAQ